jgi:kynurenine formamidase
MRTIALLLMCGLAVAQTPMSSRHLTKADVDRLMKDLSNWGRWGKDDQIGTVNLITPAKRIEGLGQVKDGVSVSLARDVEKVKAADNPAPFVQTVTHTGANPTGQFVVDTYSVDYHGQAHTHMDTLAHIFYEGKMYNGVPVSSVTEEGTERNGIGNFKEGIMSRGVLIDIPKLKGVEWLEPGAAIYPEDLDAWEKMAGIHIESGDVVFIRTGRWARRAAKGPWDAGAKGAGLYATCAKWLHERDVAIVGSDLGTDVAPSGIVGVGNPLHQLLLVAMGTPILDNCDLEAVSKAAAERKRWVFLLTAAPLAVPHGTGSPINPVATF